MSEKDGGPAFPTLETETLHPQWGMTIRDYFAAHAINGMLATAIFPEGWTPEKMAGAAYKFADAMLIARSK